MKKLAFILVFFGIIFLINQPIFAQQNLRQFIGRNDNDSLSYLEKTNQRGTGNKRQTRVKEVYSNGSYKIILIDWQCREKRFQAVESTNYAASGKYLDKGEVRPGQSSSRIRFQRITTKRFAYQPDTNPLSSRMPRAEQ